MTPRVLVLGFGNPGRQDDGIGPRCAERLEHCLFGHESLFERESLFNQGPLSEQVRPGQIKCLAELKPTLPVSIESNYQLTVEDSLTISQVDKVVFIDAAIALQHDFLFTPIEPQPETQWNHHVLSPQELLYLTGTLFNKTPQGFLLAIEGYEFNQFEERLSLRAEDNMRKACQYLQSKILQWTQGN